MDYVRKFNIKTILDGPSTRFEPMCAPSWMIDSAKREATLILLSLPQLLVLDLVFKVREDLFRRRHRRPHFRPPLVHGLPRRKPKPKTSKKRMIATPGRRLLPQFLRKPLL